jgi:hypothetical protein
MKWWARAHHATLTIVPGIFPAYPVGFSVKIVDSAQDTRAKLRALLPNL